MKKQLLILMTLCIATIGYSQTFIDNFITYNVLTSNTVEASDYDYTNGGATVNIPATVDYNSVTYNVTSIGNNAFQGNVTTLEQISSVIIPNSVNLIGVSAFSYNLLSSVTIPDSVTTIGTGAFINSQLQSVFFGNGITSIGNFAFRTNQLTSITIPNGVNNIGSRAFEFNPLTCIVSEGTTPPTIVTGGNDSFGNRTNINLSIPTGTASAYATAQWTGFNSVAEGLTGTFVVDNITYQILSNPNNEVTVIDYNTAGVTDVTIPASVNSGCTDFSVVTISANAFQNKTLTSVIMSDNVTSIGIAAFANNLLVSITIPDSVTTIGDYAFQSNPLTDVFSENLTPPTITTGGTNDTFGTAARSSIHLHIPNSTMGAYVTNAGALWTGFNPVTEDAGLSVSDFELVNDIRVITNQDLIKIIFSNNVELQNYTIYNMSGAVVATGKESEIPTTYLASGIYILRLDFDKGIVSKKVVIN